MSTLGPVDLVVLSFPVDRPPDSFLAALENVERREDVRILDALVVTKAADGTVERVELHDIESLADAAAGIAARRVLGTVGADQVDALVPLMEPGSTALALLVENVWARETAEEVRSHGGRLLASVRIPYEQIADVEAELSAPPTAGPQDPFGGPAPRPDGPARPAG
ncbi:DUF6325 family protein [Streptomyces sp. WAC06614]|uniref:DUF6325 family protein n=1 Tax=Streptomyces sp. WAC06614 TaxID=2487416 RepID=UPI000F7A63D1|nr:DUF6325 family protein [Streptomyces sp. WAC06614]RSS61444.1 hypothetical protein EF918_31840 [Streptomyces sp. WAC06614]